MSKVVEVTDQTFEEEVLKSDVPTEVDFWAPWCGPCKIVSPIYDKLADEYDNFKFCKVNVDSNTEMARKYNVVSIPMQMFFANGEKVDELLGAVPEQVIISKVQEVIQRFPTDEKGKLKVILSSWIEHNKQDSDKFRKWTEKIKQIKNSDVYKNIIETANDLDKANEKLSQLWNELQ